MGSGIIPSHQDSNFNRLFWNGSGLDPPAHDAFTRLLHRIEPDPETLWVEAQPMVQRRGGLLVLDDSTLDKVYAN